MVLGRVLVLFAFYGFHVGRFRVYRCLSSKLAIAPYMPQLTLVQRVKTLTEFRTMSITPYNLNALRDGKWQEVISSDLVPGDLVSIGELANANDSSDTF